MKKSKGFFAFKGVKTLKAVFIFILSWFCYQAHGKVCLTLQKNSTVLTAGPRRLNTIEISPSGDHILYPSDQSSLILFDLYTKEKTEFTNQISDSNLSNNYGFSKASPLAWAIDNQTLKVRNLIKKTTETKSLNNKDALNISSALSADKLMNISFSKEAIKKNEKVHEENKHLTPQEFKKIFDELSFMNANINIFDMNNLNQNHVYKLEYQKLLYQCFFITNDMTLATIQENGAIYTTSLIDSGQEPTKIFDPIEGINITSLFKQIIFSKFHNLPLQETCLFLDENTALIQDEKKEQWILRRLKEREQFIINLKERNPLISDHIMKIPIQAFFKTLSYPFFHLRSEQSTWVYHIPTGQEQILPENYLYIGKEGKFAIEHARHKEQSYIQAVHQPFDNSKKTVLLKIPKKEVRQVSLNGDKNLAFIGTFLGDLFVLNGETGYIKRYFFGESFHRIKISDSGNTFILGDINRQYYYNIHQIQEKCIEPISSFAGDLESQLQKWIQEEDPTDDKVLAVLTGILQKEEETKKYSKTIQALLWKIFLHSPLLYVDLHLYYPSLKALPPFPSTLIENEKEQAQARMALISILDNQSQLRHTKLLHWSFIKMLEPLFTLLEDKEKDLYIEKITVSLSNGATKNESLFQDIFQSKIFYVIYSHVKSWFGKDYEPVSDITVIRKKNSFQTVILSSEPIQNQNSIETDFGVHYAIMTDFSKTLNGNEVKAGQEIINNSVKWKILKGASYRAQLKIHVQDNYVEPKKFSKKDGPDYESIWQDQKMTGLVVVGSSLRSFSKTLLKNYQAYFENQGFQFSPLSVPDFELFLKEKIGECELDYFFKESHSDGDERNIFRFDRFNSVLKGVRPIGEGRSEIIYLAFPKPFHFGDRETLLFPNLELAKLVKQREQKGCGEITYFNTSCWAHVKARYEIESVNSSLLLNIPSKSLSDTFLNQEGDAIYELLSAYRNQLDFNGFRESLKKNKGYLSGKLNQYIFPDENSYYNSIYQHIKIPLKIQIDLERKQTEEWVPISPDEAL